MKSQSLSLLLLISVLFLPLFATSLRTDPLVGGWAPIKNVNDPHVKEIGEFAVDEHNKESKAALKFKTVISGESQVVSGTNYKLVVAATDGTVTKNYEAIVWEKPWLNFKKLTSFKVVN